MTPETYDDPAWLPTTFPDVTRVMQEATLGQLSASTVALVATQPVERLEELVTAVFGLADEGALRAWLEG
jgi:hypothetical protein